MVLATNNTVLRASVGCSGHGFKFGRITGRLIADLCLEGWEGRSPFDLSLFHIDRLALQPAA